MCLFRVFPPGIKLREGAHQETPADIFISMQHTELVNTHLPASSVADGQACSMLSLVNNLFASEHRQKQPWGWLSLVILVQWSCRTVGLRQKQHQQMKDEGLSESQRDPVMMMTQRLCGGGWMGGLSPKWKQRHIAVFQRYSLHHQGLLQQQTLLLSFQKLCFAVRTLVRVDSCY